MFGNKLRVDPAAIKSDRMRIQTLSYENRILNIIYLKNCIVKNKPLKIMLFSASLSFRKMNVLLKSNIQINSFFTRTNSLKCLSVGWNRHSNAQNQSKHKNFSLNSQNVATNSSPTASLYTFLSLSGITIGFFALDTVETKSKPEEIVTHEPDKNNQEEICRSWHSTERTDLPTFKLEEIAKHNSIENGVWVTYGIGVYDITKFVPNHPGSDKIMLGAGSAIDPFWAIYQQHNSIQILKLLETYRIGNINPEDEVSTDDMGSPWANEPKRHPLLKAASQKPFNAEPPLSLLAENLYTPNEFFYVRNHLPVPVIDEHSYELEIEITTDKAGTKTEQKTLGLADIKALPKQTVSAAIMCGGNRRSEMTKVKSVKGALSVSLEYHSAE